MVSKVPIPFFPQPPNEYDSGYISQIVRSFALYTEQQNAGGEGRNTGLVLTNLQTHDDELEVGALFDHDGFVKISRADRPHPRGSLGTTGLGSVTVTLP